MRLRPHVRLGPYELESVMGEGGLGDVWKARDTTNGRPVALRILPAPPAGDPYRFARFEDDVRKLITLRHLNVAAVHALIDADGVRALACEWVAGDSLATRIAAGPISVDEVIRIIAQVANGLAAAHVRDLVHGDIRPCNITLHPDGTAKATDLGLAAVYEPVVVMPPSDVWPAPSARLLGAITGTAAYMSPERIAGHPADSRADVWAFGCVLYEMLTGKPAFGGDDLADTMTRVTSAEPDWALIPPATPSSLVQMLRHCLDRDALRRFQRLTDVLGPIRATIAEEHAPEWTGDIWSELEKHIPELGRTDDVAQQTVASAARRLKGLELKSRSALSVYLRSSMQSRIEDELRRQPRRTRADPSEASSAAAARMSVGRAFRRLKDWVSRKKRD